MTPEPTPDYLSCLTGASPIILRGGYIAVPCQEPADEPRHIAVAFEVRDSTGATLGVACSSATILVDITSDLIRRLRETINENLHFHVLGIIAGRFDPKPGEPGFSIATTLFGATTATPLAHASSSRGRM